MPKTDGELNNVTKAREEKKAHFVQRLKKFWDEAEEILGRKITKVERGKAFAYPDESYNRRRALARWLNPKLHSAFPNWADLDCLRRWAAAQNRRLTSAFYRMVRQSEELRFTFIIDDHPGALVQVLSRLFEFGGSLAELYAYATVTDDESRTPIADVMVSGDFGHQEHEVIALLEKLGCREIKSHRIAPRTLYRGKLSL